MKIKKHFVYISVFVLALTSNLVYAETASLENNKFEHIQFKDIEPNQFEFRDNILAINVNKSASFLLQPFQQIKTISKVSFDWKSHGTLNVNSKDVEASREGDDAYLRIGLLIKGKPPVISFFAAGWIKKIKTLLHHPSNRMAYVVSGAQHSAGETWESPYTSSIHIISAKSSQLNDNWMRAEHRFTVAIEVVGLWIMADGDNTGSSFSTQLRNLEIH